jgi:hypothetical protein
MNLNETVSSERILSSKWPYEFAISSNREEEYWGGCPCCLIQGENFNVEISCWRENSGFSLIKINGPLDSATKEEICRHIQNNNGWTDHTDWNVEIN